jgi:hypothetical protein
MMVTKLLQSFLIQNQRIGIIHFHFLLTVVVYVLERKGVNSDIKDFQHCLIALKEDL